MSLSIRRNQLSGSCAGSVDPRTHRCVRLVPQLWGFCVISYSLCAAIMSASVLIITETEPSGRNHCGAIIVDRYGGDRVVGWRRAKRFRHGAGD